MYSNERLEEMDLIVTIIFKNDVDGVTMKDGVESDWFQKLRGYLSEKAVSTSQTSKEGDINQRTRGKKGQIDPTARHELHRQD